MCHTAVLHVKMGERWRKKNLKSTTRRRDLGEEFSHVRLAQLYIGKHWETMTYSHIGECHAINRARKPQNSQWLSHPMPLECWYVNQPFQILYSWLVEQQALPFMVIGSYWKAWSQITCLTMGIVRPFYSEGRETVIFFWSSAPPPL